MRARSMPTFRRLALAATGGLAAATLIVSPSVGSPDRSGTAAVETLAATPTAYGAAIKAVGQETYQQARTRSETRYGRLGVIRYFDGNAPDDWGSYTTKLTDHTAIISFRISPATVLTGSADAMLLAWFRKRPHRPDHVLVLHARTRRRHPAWRVHLRAVPRRVGAGRGYRPLGEQPAAAGHLDLDVLHGQPGIGSQLDQLLLPGQHRRPRMGLLQPRRGAWGLRGPGDAVLPCHPGVPRGGAALGDGRDREHAGAR
jgi:hypothetical protein